MIPQKNPFITAFMRVAPEIPKIDTVTEISTKLLIISPGGRLGTTKVIEKRAMKAIAKTTALDMLG